MSFTPPKPYAALAAKGILSSEAMASGRVSGGDSVGWGMTKKRGVGAQDQGHAGRRAGLRPEKIAAMLAVDGDSSSPESRGGLLCGRERQRVGGEPRSARWRSHLQSGLSL